MTDILPDCMLPDGAEPCAGFRQEHERVERLTTALAKAEEQLKEAYPLPAGIELLRQRAETAERQLSASRAAEERLRAALERISWESPDEEPQLLHPMGGYVSEGNSDDIAHDAERHGKWELAQIARAALSPPSRTEE